MSSFFYFLAESLTGFTRNLSTALGSIVTIFLSLLIIGIFLVGGSVVNNVVKSVEQEVNITVWIADDASSSDIQSLQSAIQSMSAVSSVSFTDKDQALENFKKSSSSDIAESLDGQNPLPASIDVELSDPQLVEDVANQIERTPRSRRSATTRPILLTRCATARRRSTTACSAYQLCSRYRRGAYRAAHLHRARVHQQHHSPGYSCSPQRKSPSCVW